MHGITVIVNSIGFRLVDKEQAPVILDALVNIEPVLSSFRIRKRRAGEIYILPSVVVYIGKCDPAVPLPVVQIPEAG